MDSKGILDLSRVVFSGGTEFSLNMVTYDEIEIPLSATIKRVNLNPFEIMPGETLSDLLEIRVLEGNPKLLANVAAQRAINSSALVDRFKFDEFTYSQNAQQFVNRFYPSNLSIATN